MAQGIEFTSFIPTSLVGNDSPSPTLAAEVVTGMPISTGAFPGNVFYLTEQQATLLSQVAVNNAPKLACHAGWYMVVQVDSGADATLLFQGGIVAQKSIPTTRNESIAAIPPAAVMTDAAKCLNLGINPAILLNDVTPGNFTIVQIAGDASVALDESETTAVGSLLQSTTEGSATVATDVVAATDPLNIGLAEEVIITPAGALTLSAVAASSGGSAVYTGTITGGGTNNYVGLYFVIAGFAKQSNNSPPQGFLCTANDTTTLTLSNPIALAETHAATATSTNLCRVQVAFPFGII